MNSMKLKQCLLPVILLCTHCSTSKPVPTEKHLPVAAALAGPLRDSAQATGSRYAVSTHGLYATRAATQILEAGGNLVDAAIATSFVLAVERPQSTGIGGGGFFLYREGRTGRVFAVDFRERAPLKATENMYVGSDGKPDTDLSQNGVLAAGVPGLVAGLLEIHKKWGTLPLQKVLQPAIDCAEKGFAVYPELFNALEARRDVLTKDPAAKAIFLNSSGEAWPVGHVLVQTDLGQTLRAILKGREKEFYRGGIAKKIVAFSKAQNGLISQKDLARYKVKWREPVRGEFLGNEIFSMPPPSSGGVHVIQFLNFLENDHLASSGFLSARSIHLAASALQSAFVDRAKYLGDPDFVKVPVAGLTDKAYGLEKRKQFSEDRARHADQLAPGQPVGYESPETTHFSMMDAEGNAIASTQTINGWMGAAVVVPGTGIVLNNEMDDFSAQVGSMNMFGAVGGKPDSIEPGKAPLSSMSPTILVRDGKVRLAVGAPGGTRIISCVAQTILNVVEFKLPLDVAIGSIRYHHQWRPEILTIDPPGPEKSVLEKLKQMGYDVQIKPIGCKVMAVAREGEKFHAVSDPRDIGTSWAK